jgi:hypothetical protein
MVTRLSNPPLVPSSMSSGGEVHSNALAMGAPGSQPISAPSPEDPGQAPERLPLPVDQAPDPVIPNRPRDPGSGQFTASGPAQSGPWRQVEGVSR